MSKPFKMRVPSLLKMVSALKDKDTIVSDSTSVYNEKVNPSKVKKKTYIDFTDLAAGPKPIKTNSTSSDNIVEIKKDTSLQHFKGSASRNKNIN